MILGGTAYGSCAFGSQTTLGHAPGDPEALYAIKVSIDQVRTEASEIGMVTIDDTLGSQFSCRIVLVNPLNTPLVGEHVTVEYYSQVLFSGAIDRISHGLTDLTVHRYTCECVDWSSILVRRKVNRIFTNFSIGQTVQSLLDNELIGEGMAAGTIDQDPVIPMLDAKGSTCFDLLRDAAGVAGQTMYVDFDKRIQFRATTGESAPIQFLETQVQDSALVTDRDTYRNRMIVTVKGNPDSSSTEDPIIVTETTQNLEQIAERAAVEGGSGRYEEYEEVTHPTSNVERDLRLMAKGYGTLRLGSSGSLRQTLTCRVQSYGFRAGQFATVDLPVMGVSGTWLIQRVAMSDYGDHRLSYDIEMVPSTLQQRAYESWLRIMKAGKVTISIPGFVALPIQTQTFTSPGTVNWIVPAGITSVTIDCLGGSGGGGGGAEYSYQGQREPTIFRNALYGGNGGNSGRTVTAVDVQPGQVLVVTVGSRGIGGTSGYTGYFAPTAPTNGTAGTASFVARGGLVVCRAEGGGAGLKAASVSGVRGADGSGSNGIVTVGGGQTGGRAGFSQYQNAANGVHGLVTITY